MVSSMTLNPSARRRALRRWRWVADRRPRSMDRSVVPVRAGHVDDLLDVVVDDSHAAVAVRHVHTRGVRAAEYIAVEVARKVAADVVNRQILRPVLPRYIKRR